jgi:hypothetical protein
MRGLDVTTSKNTFFKQRRNVAGQLGFSALHKCTVAVKMLAYGGPADELDDHLKMRESTVLETLKEFVMTVIEVFSKEFLCPPRSEKIEHILSINLARGFPRMIGSIDCMHWEWSNCPTGWQGLYRGHKGKPTLILEAVATEDLQIGMLTLVYQGLTMALMFCIVPMFLMIWQTGGHPLLSSMSTTTYIPLDTT